MASLDVATLSPLYKRSPSFFFFFFNDTATTEIYTLSLHDALPISCTPPPQSALLRHINARRIGPSSSNSRSEEHTSELQSLAYLVCRLLLEKKKNTEPQYNTQMCLSLDLRQPTSTPHLTQHTASHT